MPRQSFLVLRGDVITKAIASRIGICRAGRLQAARRPHRQYAEPMRPALSREYLCRRGARGRGRNGPFRTIFDAARDGRKEGRGFERWWSRLRTSRSAARSTCASAALCGSETGRAGSDSLPAGARPARTRPVRGRGWRSTFRRRTWNQGGGSRLDALAGRHLNRERQAFRDHCCALWAACRSRCSNASVKLSSSWGVIPSARPSSRHEATAFSTSASIVFARSLLIRK